MELLKRYSLHLTRENKIAAVILLCMILILTAWHKQQVAEIEKVFIEEQVQSNLRIKQIRLESVFKDIYDTLRAISLLPVVRAITGDNRQDPNDDIVKEGRFSADAVETVQELYNNLAVRVNVSEIYNILDGFDYAKQQVPFFMFDTIRFGNVTENIERNTTSDTPDEMENEEYRYFPEQLTTLKLQYPRFSAFKRMDDIPTILSPPMRTCDNAQYCSIETGNVQDSYGFLSSVPFYSQSGEFRGIISAITRLNIYEAILLDVPIIPVIEDDYKKIKREDWEATKLAPFILVNKGYGINISDRRYKDLEKLIKEGIPGRNVFEVTLNVHADKPWKLIYFLSENFINAELAQQRTIYLILLITVIVSVSVAAFTVSALNNTRKYLGGSVNEIGHIVEAVSQGNLMIHIPVDTSRKSVMGRMAVMLDKLRTAEYETREAFRVKSALDNVSTNVMIVNDERKIIYLNASIIELFHLATKEIQGVIPGFNSENVLGSNFDYFVSGDAKQLLEHKNNHELAVGSRIFTLAINPVVDQVGQRLGTVIEWNDLTKERQIQNEVAEIVHAASAGDLRHRVDLSNKEGFFHTLGDGVNQMLTATEVAINETVLALERIAAGDLTAQVVAHYGGTYGKIIDNANLTVQRLSAIVREIQQIVCSITAASREIASGNTDLSTRTEEQASSLESTARDLANLANTVRVNANHAAEATTLAKAASEVAIKGGDAVEEVVRTMDSINESARKIVDITSVIDGIAFQTNILALNAAVEAARAGEQGRGFAVVAGEVRSLAQRSAEAAKEIKRLISDSMNKVENGTTQVGTAGKTIRDVVTSVQQVSEVISLISTASHQQSLAISTVNDAVGQMDETTQKNAALVEEAAAAAESLEQQAGQLNAAVSIFRLE